MIIISEITTDNLLSRLDSFIDDRFYCNEDSAISTIETMHKNMVELGEDIEILYVMNRGSKNRETADDLVASGLINYYWEFDDTDDNKNLVALEGYILELTCVSVSALVNKYKTMLNNTSVVDTTEYDEKITELEEELARTKALLTDLEVSATSNGQVITDANTEKERLQGIIDSLNDEITDLNRKHSAELLAKEQEYDTNIESVKAELQREIEKCSKTVEELTTRVRAKETELTETTTELDSTKAELRALQTTNENLQQTLSSNSINTDELVELQGNVSRLESENTRYKDEVANLTDTNTNLESQIDSLTTQLELYRQQLESKDKNYTRLDEQLQSTLAELNTLRTTQKDIVSQGLVAKPSVATATEKLYDIGLDEFRSSNTIIIGVCGYGSSEASSNVAVSIANSLGLINQVAIIDLDESYVGMNLFYNTSRKTSDVGGVKDTFVHRLSTEVPQYLGGFACVRRNKSGEVYYGGGTLGGLEIIPEGALVKELNGLSSSVSFVVLHLGCITPAKMPVLYELYAHGRLVMVSSNNAMHINLLKAQLQAQRINPTDLSWVLSVNNNEPTTEKALSLLSGINYIEEKSSDLASRMSLDVGKFNVTFSNFVNNIIQ